jgi:hypothetical protein
MIFRVPLTRPQSGALVPGENKGLLQFLETVPHHILVDPVLRPVHGTATRGGLITQWRCQLWGSDGLFLVALHDSVPCTRKQRLMFTIRRFIDLIINPKWKYEFHKGRNTVFDIFL